jgi:hypothetical protein
MISDPVFTVSELEQFGKDTGIFDMMNTSWAWPLFEIIHFTGLCMLMVSVGMLDLRMMGVARGVPMQALHRLVPIGVAGFALCAVTGVCFFLTAPGQYLYNPAFQTKMSFMALAGVNMAIFYATTAGSIRTAGPDDLAIPQARLIAFISLASWIIVITCGRVITFFRPPYFWCVWCS